jgi:hypothetical protein
MNSRFFAERLRSLTELPADEQVGGPWIQDGDHWVVTLDPNGP